MSEVYVSQISQELQVSPRQVSAASELLAAGSTVPFIARYRKEATGGLDEVKIIAIRDRLEQLRELDARRETVLKSLQDQGKLTDELKQKVTAAATMSALEDIYLPYRPKRRTRGMMAIENGLEPLAKRIFEQGNFDPAAEAGQFVDAEKGVASADDALAGARDIIAEWVNEDAAARTEIRDYFAREAQLVSKVIDGKQDQGAKYKDYFDWHEPIATAPSHRILAIRRGEKEGILYFKIQPDEDRAVAMLERRFVTAANAAASQVRLAVQDSYKRLMSLSIETDIRLEAKKRADAEAIRVFAENLRELLLASPLGQKRVLAVDPGLRTGCKIVWLDAQGKLLGHDVIFPIEPYNRTQEAAAKLRQIAQQYEIEAVAIGNGTGGRKAEAFCRGIDFGRPVTIVMVNESGASVYSASEVAREEFADQDVTVRGSVSIGRRLMDPLAELVKIDPKSIGVGQYQHDVDQKLLKTSLDDVVGSCVNAVGVEVNTASKELLSYVSGLGPKLVGSVMTYRNEHGPFKRRKDLLEVPGLGPKTFEQSAGFLRIRQSEHPLDASSVHPESYPIVEAMARDAACTIAELMADPQRRSQIDLKKYVTHTVGLPTLTDIMAELAKPGRDPRKQFEAFSFAQGVHDLKDLQPGMRLPGIVTNVTAFGAFVDVGVHQDGLVHISELADKFIKDPAEVVKVQQRVTVTVLSVDLERRRIALSMRTDPGEKPTAKSPASSPVTTGAKPLPKGPASPQGKPQQARGTGQKPSGKADPRPDPNNPFVDFFKKWKKE